MPTPSAVRLRVLPPSVSTTVALASVLPLTIAVCSPALTMSSPATRLIVGAEAGAVSTLMFRVPATPVFPALSVAVAESVSAPWPMAVMSAATSV